MLGWAAIATQAPTIAPAVTLISRMAAGDLGKKRGIEAILQTLNRRVFRPFVSPEPRHAATVSLFGVFEFSLIACGARQLPA